MDKETLKELMKEVMKEILAEEKQEAITPVKKQNNTKKVEEIVFKKDKKPRAKKTKTKICEECESKFLAPLGGGYLCEKCLRNKLGL